MVNRGNNVFTQISAPLAPKIAQQLPDSATDIILHALIARVTYKNGNKLEFRTVFDKKTNTIELEVPENGLAVFDELQGIQQGPRFRQFIDWLIGRQSVISDAQSGGGNLDLDSSFVSSSDLKIWAGATIGNMDDEKIVIFLPTNCLSVLGYNAKMASNFGTNSVKISLIWVFEGGSNASFDIQTKVSAGEINGNNVATVDDTANISTFNLIKGDIRETELITVSGVQSDDILSIIMQRNYDGSPDPTTEFVGVLGIKVEKVV